MVVVVLVVAAKLADGMQIQNNGKQSGGGFMLKSTREDNCYITSEMLLTTIGDRERDPTVKAANHRM